jgi:hypothetical protein
MDRCHFGMLVVQADRHTQFRKSAVLLRSWNAGGMTMESGSAYGPKQPVSAGPGPWSHNTEPGSAEFGTKAGQHWARIGHGTRLINFGRARFDAFEVPPDKQPLVARTPMITDTDDQPGYFCHLSVRITWA